MRGWGGVAYEDAVPEGTFLGDRGKAFEIAVAGNFSSLFFDGTFVAEKIRNYPAEFCRLRDRSLSCLLPARLLRPGMRERNAIVQHSASLVGNHAPSDDAPGPILV